MNRSPASVATDPTSQHTRSSSNSRTPTIRSAAGDRQSGCDHVPGAAKALNAFTLCLASSRVAREGVQEVAIVLHLLAIGVREHTQLVRQWRRIAGSTCGK